MSQSNEIKIWKSDRKMQIFVGKFPDQVSFQSPEVDEIKNKLDEKVLTIDGKIQGTIEKFVGNRIRDDKKSNGHYVILCKESNQIKAYPVQDFYNFHKEIPVKIETLEKAEEIITQKIEKKKKMGKKNENNKKQNPNTNFNDDENENEKNNSQSEKEDEEDLFDEINDKSSLRMKKQASKNLDENKEIYNVEKSDSGDEEEHIISGEEEFDVPQNLRNPYDESELNDLTGLGKETAELIEKKKKDKNQNVVATNSPLPSSSSEDEEEEPSLDDLDSSIIDIEDLEEDEDDEVEEDLKIKGKRPNEKFCNEEELRAMESASKRKKY